MVSGCELRQLTMFTGLVLRTGSVARVATAAGGARLRIDAPLAPSLAAGDSVLVNGVCLTAVAVDDGAFEADVSPETLRRTAFADLRDGDEVNLELALRAEDRLGGHIVQGHVDGVAEVAAVAAEGDARNLRVEAPAELLRYVVEKGSVTLDGVSLTVTDVDGSGFGVSLIPETLERTNLGGARPGRRVNLEVDVLAKYVEKLLPDRERSQEEANA
jgi:riboflavin synthase